MILACAVFCNMKMECSETRNDYIIAYLHILYKKFNYSAYVIIIQYLVQNKVFLIYQKFERFFLSYAHVRLVPIVIKIINSSFVKHVFHRLLKSKYV